MKILVILFTLMLVISFVSCTEDTADVDSAVQTDTIMIDASTDTEEVLTDAVIAEDTAVILDSSED